MKQLFCFVIVLIGLVLSYPMTILVIAWQQANDHADWIHKVLNKSISPETKELIEKLRNEGASRFDERLKEALKKKRENS